MKSLSEYILEAKNAVPEYSRADINAVNAKTKYFKLMLGIEEDIEHVYIKNPDASRFFEKNGVANPYLEADILKDIVNVAPDLAKNIYVLVGNYKHLDKSVRINNFSREYYNPKLPITGMFFASPKEAKIAARQYKYSVVPETAKSGKILVMSLYEYIELEKNHKITEFGANFNPLRFFETY
jgi:hypothetical protein